MKKYTLAIILIFGLLSLTAQTDKKMFVKKIDQKMSIDGRLDESIWSQLASKADGFTQYFPTDTLPAKSDTEIYTCYDDKALYIGIRCYGDADKWIVPSLKRDFRGGGNDNITILLDSYHDKTNAYLFGINPQGVCREGVVTNGGNNFRDFDVSWDNKWRGNAVIHDDHYSAELMIPFSALRYIDGSKEWYLSAYRFDTQQNEWSTWTAVPQNLPMMCLGFGATMEWEEPLKSKRNIAVIPYVSADYSKDYTAEADAMTGASIGGDAKIGVTSGLNLDLTINPDFSQVEVDRQITDLSRFEIFFPERRQFFLENADLFSSFGFGNMNPFFSRRIGVARNAGGETIQNQIYAGARLSGKLSDRTRVGLLNMQTADDAEHGIAGANYTVAALQQQVLGRSNVSFVMVNKQLSKEDASTYGFNRYNRVAGVDFNYANANNTIYGKTFLHGSWIDGQESSLPLSHGMELKYDTRGWDVTWSHEYVDADFVAETGFIRRRDYYRIDPRVERTYYPSSGQFNRLGVELRSNIWWKPEIGKTDHTISLRANAQTKKNNNISATINHKYVYLFGSFDPTGTSSTPLAEGTEYNYMHVNLSYRSARQNIFNYRINSYLGQYFSGHRYGLSGMLGWRSEPRLQIAADFNFNYFDMPYLEEGKRTFLIGPRVDYTFSKKVFFTTFLQYNTQSKNTNINSRLQWRFAPVSDFFLVFTDNYATGAANPEDRFSFNIKNRALVAKLTYWISG